jgi:hypothetical protein
MKKICARWLGQTSEDRAPEPICDKAGYGTRKETSTNTRSVLADNDGGKGDTPDLILKIKEVRSHYSPQAIHLQTSASRNDQRSNPGNKQCEPSLPGLAAQDMAAAQAQIHARLSFAAHPGEPLHRLSQPWAAKVQKILGWASAGGVLQGVEALRIK